MINYKILLWDLDGTILDFAEAQRNALLKGFKLHKLGNCTDSMIASYDKINHNYWQKIEKNEIAKKDALEQRFIDFFDLYSLDKSKAKTFNDEYQINLGDTIAFTPNAFETLKYLNNKVIQYAVTNGTSVAQHNKLKKSSLDKIFKKAFISDELGYEKPSKAFFDIVFNAIKEEYDFTKEEILIIGDSLTSDIQGGINAGIKTVWYNPKKAPNTNNLHIDYEITDIQQVKDIVLGN